MWGHIWPSCRRVRQWPFCYDQLIFDPIWDRCEVISDLLAEEWGDGPDEEDWEDPHEEGEDWGEQKAPPFPLLDDIYIYIPIISKNWVNNHLGSFLKRRLTWEFLVSDFFHESTIYISGPDLEAKINFWLFSKFLMNAFFNLQQKFKV